MDIPYGKNLRNLHNAMDYDNNGRPLIRVSSQSVPDYNTGNTNTGIDSFGRSRVSTPYTLFDMTFRYDDSPHNFDIALTGGGTSTHAPNESCIKMQVNGNGDSVIRQTKKVFKYQPGKSLLVLQSFVFNQPTSGLIQRIGYYNNNNGIYLMAENTDIYFVIRKNITGVVDDLSEKIHQQNWNIDKLDGSGPSGVNIDFSKAQIFYIDVEYLGVGSVRAGFVVNGVFIIAHIFHHANLINGVYMASATLPCRAEITSNGAVGTMKQICMTVISEGGYQDYSISQAASSPLVGTTISNLHYTPVISIRLKSDKIDTVVIPKLFNIYGFANAPYRYALIYGGSLNTPSWQTNLPRSAIEYDVSSTLISGGLTLIEGLFSGGNHGGGTFLTSGESDLKFQIGRNISGVSDVVSLCAIATSNNDKATASLVWQEMY